MNPLYLPFWIKIKLSSIIKDFDFSLTNMNSEESVLISYCWKCLWGDSVFGSPSFQVHLLGKSGRIHFLSMVPSEPFSMCSTFILFTWWPFVSFTWSVPFTLNLCAAFPFKTASVFSSASPLMPDSPFAAFVRTLAACGQTGPVPTDSELDGTDGMVYLWEETLSVIDQAFLCIALRSPSELV